jgi:hypothetical protein
MSLDHELKRALHAQDPGDDFTARVMERVRAARHAERASGPSATPSAGNVVEMLTEHPPHASASRTTRPRMVAWFAAMAATLALTVGGAEWIKHRQEVAEGERARAEVLTALRLTSAKLSKVHAAVADQETR